MTKLNDEFTTVNKFDTDTIISIVVVPLQILSCNKGKIRFISNKVAEISIRYKYIYSN